VLLRYGSFINKRKTKTKRMPVNTHAQRYDKILTQDHDGGSEWLYAVTRARNARRIRTCQDMPHQLPWQTCARNQKATWRR
jgi:hypothetical protein